MVGRSLYSGSSCNKVEGITTVSNGLYPVYGKAVHVCVCVWWKKKKNSDGSKLFHYFTTGLVMLMMVVT